MWDNELGSAPLWCEQCGEQEQEVPLDEVGLCIDCAGDHFSQALQPSLGYRPCGRPLFKDGSLTSVCIKPYGTEHDHG